MCSQPRLTLPPTLRIKGRTDFNAVFEQGWVLSDAVLVVHILPRANQPSRLGISISKKVGSAPVRNRWKRLLREAFRLNQASLPPGLDLVVRPRKGARAEYHAIQASLRSLGRRAAGKRKSPQ